MGTSLLGLETWTRLSAKCLPALPHTHQGVSPSQCQKLDFPELSWVEICVLGRALGISLWKERRQDRGTGRRWAESGGPGGPAGCRGGSGGGDGSSVIEGWAKGSLGPWLWAAALRDGA